MGIFDSLFGAARVKANEAAETLISSETQMKAHILKLEDTYNESNSEYLRFKTDLDIAEQDIEKKQAEVSRIDAGITSMQGKFAALSEDEKASQKASFTAKAQVLLDQKQNFENQLEALIKKRDQIKPGVETLSQNLKEIAEQIKTAKNNLSEMSTRAGIADTQIELAEAIKKTRSSTDPSKSKFEEDIQRREAKAQNMLNSVKKDTATDYQDILADVEKQEKPQTKASDLFQ